MAAPMGMELLGLAQSEALRPYEVPRSIGSRILRAQRDYAIADAKAREDEAWWRYEMYRARQMQFLDKLEAETPDDFAKRRNKETRSLTRLIVDMKGMAYRLPAARAIKDPDGGDPEGGELEAIAEWLGRVWSDQVTSLDHVMKRADRLSYLLGNCAIRPWWDGVRIRYRMYRKNQLRIVANERDPLRPLAIMPRWHTCDAHGKPYTHAEVWTDELFAEHDRDGWTVPVEHGYGRIPIVSVWDELPDDDYWSEGRGGPIVDTNTIVNNLLTDFNNTAEYQSFSTAVMIGPGMSEVDEIGPGVPIRMNRPDGSSFAWVSPDWPVDQLLTFVRDKIDALLESERIPKSAVRLDTQASSGIQIIAENLPLDDYREERTVDMRRAEQELAQVTLLVGAHHDRTLALDPVPVDALPAFRLHVDYVEPSRPLDRREVREDRRFELEQGLTAPWRLWMRDDPDKYPTEEAAIAAWLEFQERRAEVAESEPVTRVKSAEEPPLQLDELLGPE